MSTVTEIRPHPGPQEEFLASPADIVIYGGQAGGGKTYGLLMEPCRHIDNPGFGVVVFRRISKDITNEGGLWDVSHDIYPGLGAEPFQTPSHEWRFPSGARVGFHHMQHEKDRFGWKGAQIPLIEFDQLEEFTERQFWYLFSRNRSTCGVAPYIRATANPVPPDDPVGGWLCRLIDWWIDDDGYAHEERAGVVRWFVRVGDELLWGDDPDELAAEASERTDIPASEYIPKSLTFIPAALEDNPTLMEADPGYKANLMALSRVERERLLGGNWYIRAEAGEVFDRSWFEVVEAAPEGGRSLRYWDKAATEGAGCQSAGVLLRLVKGVTYILDVTAGHWSSMKRENVTKQKAEADGRSVPVVVEQEPGSGGKESAEATIRNLRGWNVRADRVTGDKVERAMPMSAQAEAGNVKLVRGSWNEAWLNQAHHFPEGMIDQVDAAVGAFNWLTKGGHATTVDLPRMMRTVHV